MKNYYNIKKQLLEPINRIFLSYFFEGILAKKNPEIIEMLRLFAIFSVLYFIHVYKHNDYAK